MSNETPEALARPDMDAVRGVVRGVVRARPGRPVRVYDVWLRVLGLTYAETARAIHDLIDRGDLAWGPKGTVVVSD